MSRPARWLSFLLTIATLYLVTITVAYRTIPSSNTHDVHFDAIIVLGTPSLANGTPSPEQRERTLEGVREFHAGIAPRIIMTGGAAHNRVIEAHTMVEYAAALGVPREDLLEEGHAENTIQNIFYSQALMRSHGWHTAEVVSSPSHLPRSALILEHYNFLWRTHPAHWPPEYTIAHRAAIYWAEATYCSKLRLLGFRRSPFLPAAH